MSTLEYRRTLGSVLDDLDRFFKGLHSAAPKSRWRTPPDERRILKIWRILTCVGAGVLLYLVYGQLAESPSMVPLSPPPEVSLPSPPPPVEPLPPPARKTQANLSPPTKRFAKLSEGRWVRRAGPYTQADVVRDYGANAADVRGEKTGLLVTSWTWSPMLPGRVMRDWDGYDFTKRMLNSDIGLLMVGDSLTNQMMAALGSIGGAPGMLGVTRYDSYEVDTAPHSSHYFSRNNVVPSTLIEITLKLKSDWYSRLREELPHVPEWRFREPFARTVRHDTLVDLPELKGMVRRLGKVPNFYDDGVHFLRTHDWKPYLRRLSSTPTWPGQQNSMAVLNTGPHVTPYQLGCDAQTIDKLHTLIAREIMSFMKTIPRLDTMYRSTSPGQPRCTAFRRPFYPARPFADHHKVKAYGWGAFGQYNEIWGREMDRLSPTGQSDDLSGSMVFLNVSEMSLQRPDSRVIKRMDKPDCLHWSLPGVPSHWIRMMWHIISKLDEDRN